MTRHKRAGKIIRWGLFTLWVLCLGAGILYLFGTLFENSYDAGLIGTSCIFLSYFYYFLENLTHEGSAVFWVLNITYIGLFIFTQWLFLSDKIGRAHV